MIVLAFAVNLLSARPDVPAAAGRPAAPAQGTDSMLLAAGILGATVMPHVIYVHSALTPNRIPAADEAERRIVARACAPTCCSP